MPARIKPRAPVPVFLAEWREHLKLSQQYVGDRIGDGITKTTVSRWENARRAPSLDVLAAYAEALGIPIGNLYRPPEAVPSVDAMIAGAPEELQRQVAAAVDKIIRAPEDQQQRVADAVSMIAGAPAELQRRAADVVGVMLKPPA